MRKGALVPIRLTTRMGCTSARAGITTGSRRPGLRHRARLPLPHLQAPWLRQAVLLWALRHHARAPPRPTLPLPRPIPPPSRSSSRISRGSSRTQPASVRRSCSTHSTAAATRPARGAGAACRVRRRGGSREEGRGQEVASKGGGKGDEVDIVGAHLCVAYVSIVYAHHLVVVKCIRYGLFVLISLTLRLDKAKAGANAINVGLRQRPRGPSPDAANRTTSSSRRA